MVNESEMVNKKLLKLFDKFVKKEMADRKRFYLGDLQDFFLKELNDINKYTELGGYKALYKLIKKKEKEGKIRSIKNSSFNGRDPVLKEKWQLIKDHKNHWEEKKLLKLSSRLDLGYYLKRPELQTPRLLSKLENIYDFFINKDKREWASREERSLELFGDEKFLSTKSGKKLLNRLKLKLSDLRAEKFSQMFVYWKTGIKINKVLILENHSTFISCKRARADSIPIFSLYPDTLIYGGGKHIIKSLEFLEEIAEIDEVEIYYAGDIDPAGFMIYDSLKQRYPEYDLKLFIEFYKKMLDKTEKGYKVQAAQNKKDRILQSVLSEFADEFSKNSLISLWQKNLRVPQEVITYEVLKKYNEI